jgi:hypothetical protein
MGDWLTPCRKWSPAIKRPSTAKTRRTSDMVKTGVRRKFSFAQLRGYARDASSFVEHAYKKPKREKVKGKTVNIFNNHQTCMDATCAVSASNGTCVCQATLEPKTFAQRSSDPRPFSAALTISPARDLPQSAPPAAISQAAPFAPVPRDQVAGIRGLQAVSATCRTHPFNECMHRRPVLCVVCSVASRNTVCVCLYVLVLRVLVEASVECGKLEALRRWSDRTGRSHC